MNRTTAIAALLAILAAAPAAAQPTLASLWPNDDGLRLTYQYTLDNGQTGEHLVSPAFLQLEGYAMTAGGEAQVLLAEHADVPQPATAAGYRADGLPGLVWRARPDLRARIERLYPDAAKADKAEWRPVLLHGGFFMKGDEAVQMWQESWNHPTWTYLRSDLAPGATFVHQLLPEIVDDIFLHGTVGAVGVEVATLAGTFDDAVRMDYLVDLGQAAVTDEEGTLIGVIHGEIRGHVSFVPGVGPVEMLEESLPFLTVDCQSGDCPPEWAAWLGQVVETQTLSLSAAPVPAVDATWGGLKSLYR